MLAVSQQAVAAPSTPIQQPQTPAAFTIAPVITNPLRLAMTPKLDGKLEEEEWDPFASTSCDGYLQWQPGKIHVGAKLAVGQDLLVSLDLAGDGWLRGSDNVELRVKWNGTAPEIAARRLDGARPEGPAWMDAASIVGSAKAAGAVEGDKWMVEVILTDPGTNLLPEKSGAQIGARLDAVAPTDLFTEPYLPRAVAMVNLVMDRAGNLPTGFKWSPEFKGRSVVPGESFRIRMTFNGTDMLDFKRIDLRTEGLAKNQTSSSGYPFPSFDRKGRAFVDYETAVQSDADEGWRVLRGTITDGAGHTTLLQTSYEIAPVVQFDFDLPTKLASSSEPQKLRLSTYIRSNTKKRVTGIFRIAPSTVFTVDNGADKPFVIYNARGSKRQVFEVTVPGGFKGALPITLVAEVGTITHEETVWLNIP